MASVLKVEQLVFQYPGAPQAVFEGLDFSIARGEFVAVVGGSGVGKSTLLRIVAGLVSATHGSVVLDVLPRAGTRCSAIVFQDGRLLPWRRLRANVAYGLRGLGLAPGQIRARVDEVLALTRLDGLVDRWPHQLSGGQVQRAGIARALVLRPDLLLMDEPFSAVDAITRRHLQDELLNLWRQTGAAVLFITHDIEEAAYLADRVVVLAGTPASIRIEHQIKLPRPRAREDAVLQCAASQIAALL